MNDDPTLVAAVLGELGIAEELEPATIEASNRVCASAADAIAAFLEAATEAPQGWLCDALSPAIAILPCSDETRLAGAWPLWGECVFDFEGALVSRSIRRVDAGWEVVTYRRVAAEEGFIRLVERIGRKEAGRLLYEVAYQVQTVGTHEELRPKLSRFVGFKKARS